MNNLNILLDDFINYIYIERKLSDNTKDSYKRDLTRYIKYLNSKKLMILVR